jgi:16S rRNA C1402 (ribose-2'-O) methylase RsmI
MQLAAAQTRSDYELQRGGVANHGTVEAVAPLLGASDRYVVVTRELTTATATTAYQGLRPAWHIAIATVARQPRGEWVVSGWQPES